MIMNNFFEDLYQTTQQQNPAVLCIVTETQGSTPRKAGAKMLVFPDGSIKGTIGGGSIEHQVIKEALALHVCGEPLLKSFHLLEDLNMQCGGSMQVYMERIGCLPKLHIFGAGHIGKAVASFASQFGFKPYVYDQRKDIFNDWDVPTSETHVGEYLQMLDTIALDKNSYIVIVTPQHEHDEKLLLACANKPWAYLGMIGSKRKVTEIRKKALSTLTITEETLDRIDMPIGIPFAAETPSEIAISIVAKLIDVKNTSKNHELS